jgi:hypothetical protein
LIVKFEAHSYFLQKGINKDDKIEVADLKCFKDMQGVLGKFYVSELQFLVIHRQKTKAAD